MRPSAPRSPAPHDRFQGAEDGRSAAATTRNVAGSWGDSVIIIALLRTVLPTPTRLTENITQHGKPATAMRMASMDDTGTGHLEAAPTGERNAGARTAAPAIAIWRRETAASFAPSLVWSESPGRHSAMHPVFPHVTLPRWRPSARLLAPGSSWQL